MPKSCIDMDERLRQLLLHAVDCYKTGGDILNTRWLRAKRVTIEEQVAMTLFIQEAIREKIAAQHVSDTPRD